MTGLTLAGCMVALVVAGERGEGEGRGVREREERERRERERKEREKGERERGEGKSLILTHILTV